IDGVAAWHQARTLLRWPGARGRGRGRRRPLGGGHDQEAAHQGTAPQWPDGIWSRPCCGACPRCGFGTGQRQGWAHCWEAGGVDRARHRGARGVAGK
ncbi:unnamed protein product, partial [Prorocentrum cordatum]